MPDTKRIARVSPGTLYREVRGEAVLLHLDTGEYFGLDEVANRVWQLIVEKSDLDEVETAMRQEFEVDQDLLSNDLSRLIEDLLAKGLIEIDRAAPGPSPR